MEGTKNRVHLINLDDGRTPSVTPSARGPQEHGACRDHRTCTPHNTPVLYVPAGHEVCAGQRMSVPGLQLYLYKWLPIGKLPQPGPYTGPYFTKAHDQHEPNHQGGPKILPDPLSDHLPCRLSTGSTSKLTQCPHKKIQVQCQTSARQHNQ